MERGTARPHAICRIATPRFVGIDTDALAFRDKRGFRALSCGGAESLLAPHPGVD